MAQATTTLYAQGSDYFGAQCAKRRRQALAYTAARRLRASTADDSKPAPPKPAAFLPEALSGTITIALGDMLAQIRTLLATNASAVHHIINIGARYIDPGESNGVGTFVDQKIYVPRASNLAAMFKSEATFLGQYAAVFGVPFAETFASSVFPKVKVSVKRNEAAEARAQSTVLQQLYFRQITCLLLRQKFGIVPLDACVCYPTNISEHVAWQSGVFKNCYSPECSNYIAQNPLAVDPLFVGPCQQASGATQIAIAYIKATASSGTNINIKISQLIEDYQSRQTV